MSATNKPFTQWGGVLSLLLMASATMAADRWYSDEQVGQGASLFAEHCASCHGNKGQGLTPDWKKTGPDGKYPPPPINGAAHAWHHPLTLLQKTIRDGGVRLGGSMPGFAEKVNAEQIDALIAWVQSQWPDTIYSAWMERRGLKGSQYDPARSPQAPAVNALPVKSTPVKSTPVKSIPVKSAPSALLASLRKRLPGVELGKPVASPVANVLSVNTGDGRIYVTSDGRYAFIGDLIDLQKGVNLSENQRRLDRLALAEGFPEKDRIVFPARGEEKAKIMVFTDTSCPYCRKQHAQLAELNQAGVSVHYLPFPRGGERGPGYAGLRAVWCAPDRQQAMNQTMNQAMNQTMKQAKPIASAAGNKPGNCAKAALVDKGYELGNAMGIRGTPAMLLPNGKRIDGFRPAASLIQALGL